MTPRGSGRNQGGSPEDRLARIVAECSDRLNSGKGIDEKEILAENPDLADKLIVSLDLLREASPPTSRPFLPKKMGDYRIVGEIGRGGMGIIYEAWQVSRRRRVALKLLAPGLLPSAKAVERFQVEAKVSSRLDFPGICPIYEAGLSDGIPYIAMPIIDGETLAERLSRARERDEAKRQVATSTVLGSSPDDGPALLHRNEMPSAAVPKTLGEIQEVLFLIERVARTLHLAHEAGLIHRDIKPSNIMVTPAGDPVILDFGLARDDREELRKATPPSQILGTPAYMSPERISPGRGQSDRRTDIYSLGVTLFECLTLQHPFEAATREGMYQKILKGEPPDPREINPCISKRVKVVLEGAMERDIERRYRTALEFADDLRRVRGGEPILAHGPGSLRQMRRFARRKPLLVASVLSLTLFLIGWLAVSLIALDRTNRSLRRSQGLFLTAQSRTELEKDPTLSLLLAIEGARRENGPMAADALNAALGAVQEIGTLASHRDAVLQASFSPDDRWLATASRDGTARISKASTGEGIVELRGHDDAVNDVRFSPDSRWVVTASDDHTARIWEVPSGEIAATLEHDDGVNSARFSSDGTRVLTASWDETARIWDAESGARLMILGGHEGNVHLADFSPDGRWVVTACDAPHGSVRLWSAESGELLREQNCYPTPVSAVAFSPDGQLLLTASLQGTGRVWELSTGVELETLEGHSRALICASFSPDSRRLATGSDDSTVRVWDPRTGVEIAPAMRHPESVSAVAFSPRGTEVLSGSWDGIIRVWDAASGAQGSELRGHDGPIGAVSWSSNGERMVSASKDGTARLWKARADSERWSLNAHVDLVSSVAFDRRGERLITASRDRTARVWDVRSGKLLLSLEGHVSRVAFAAFSPHGDRLITVASDHTVRTWEASDGSEIYARSGHSGVINHSELSLDGSRVATSSIDRTARIWDASSGEEIAVLRGHEGSVDSVAFSPDRAWVVTASNDRTVRIWDVSSSREVARFQGFRGGVLSAKFSPDARQVVAACADGTFSIWDCENGVMKLSVLAHRTGINVAAFSPDGERIVTASRDGTAAIWDPVTGSKIAAWEGSGAAIVFAKFSPDGRTVLTIPEHGPAALWEAASGRELVALQGHEAPVSCADFSPDGNWVATATANGRVRLWPVDPMASALARKPRDLSESERRRFGLPSAEESLDNGTQKGIAATSLGKEDHKLRFGICSGKAAGAVRRRLQPALEHLENELSRVLPRPVRLRLRVYHDPRLLHRHFLAGYLDLARLDPADYVRAKDVDYRIDLLAVEIGTRDNGGGESGIIAVRTDSGISSLEALREHSFALGTPRFANLTYFAKTYLADRGIFHTNLKSSVLIERWEDLEPELYSERLDAALFEESAFETLKRRGASIQEIARITSIPPVWAARAGLSPSVASAIEETLLRRGTHPALLQAFEAVGFREPESDFDDSIRQLMLKARAFGRGSPKETLAP